GTGADVLQRRGAADLPGRDGRGLRGATHRRQLHHRGLRSGGGCAVMTGAKLGQRIGWALIFRCVLGVFAASSLAMILSRTVTWAIIGQLLAGAAAAIIVPALVALIAENYRGP